MDDLKKESFDLKLRVYQLEDALRKVADVHAVHSENENLKSANEALRMELQSLKSVLVETQSDMEMSRREQGYLYAIMIQARIASNQGRRTDNSIATLTV